MITEFRTGIFFIRFISVRLTLLILLTVVTATLEAQNITNILYHQEGKTVVVSYDLTGGEQGQKFTVNLFVSEDGGSTFKGPLQAVTGDVGSGITTGYSKQIIWEVLSEPGRERLQGDNIKFKVRAEYTPSSSGLEPDMVFVQGGTFQMGSNEGDDEKPVHSVTVGSFYIGKYEVTQKQWRNIMGSDPPELYFKGCAQCPVDNVSWNDVQEFIQKLNQRTGKTYRLPTEAEWEYAARGGKQSRGYTYSGSNEVGEVAWYTENSGYKRYPVGQKKPNELGLYDMTGNVREWCNDWYGYDYYQSTPSSNPQGPSNGYFRVGRGGGSYNDKPAYQRVARRFSLSPSFRRLDTGFRLARTE